MLTTLIILALSAAFFVSGKVRSDIVALCSLIALLVFHILTPEEALSGFSNSVVVMMVGLFVVGGAIFQTGLAKMISSRLLKLAGKSELKLFLLVMIATSAIGAFVSNTGTVALMLPIVVSLALNAGTQPARLLMPLAFASSMGGMMTLIGTPPNLIIDEVLTNAGYEPLAFFSFLPVGLLCVLTGIVVLLPLTRWFLSKKQDRSEQAATGKSLNELVKEYGLSNNLFRLRATTTSGIVGQTILALDVRRRYGLNILEVRRGEASQHRFLKTITQKVADTSTTLQTEDILYVKGDFDRVKQLECRMAAESGADEIDIVLPLHLFLAGEYAETAERIREIKEILQEKKLKVILETGVLASPTAIAAASFLAMEAGADFIKTSTGKLEPAATPMAAIIMCNAIKRYYIQCGRKVGFKAAGGMTATKDALCYYSIVDTILGKEWLNKEYFRLGTSRLANAILSELEKKTVNYY